MATPAEITPMRVRSYADLTLEVAESVAYGGVRLELDPALRDELDTSRAAMLAALESGGPVYGATTGAGYMSKETVEGSRERQHSANLLLGRAVGSAPFMAREEARMLMVAKLVSLVSGAAGVSSELCSFIVDRLNDDFTPAVPRTAVGSAGEVIALSHTFQTMMGVGAILDADGTTVPAADGLAERDVAPYAPAAKEGIALLAGAPGTVALTIGALREARGLLPQLVLAAAFSTTALGAPQNPYAPQVADLAGDPLLGDVLARYRALLGPEVPSRSASVQAPISFRVAPQHQVHLERVISRLDGDVRRALGAVSDSPAFVGDAFYSTGAFHEIELAAGLDALSLALAQFAEVATQRIHRMLDGRFTDLPSQLTGGPGNTGLIVVHKRAVGAVNELRRLAAPASIGITETSLGQEDAMTFAFEAAEKVRRAFALVRDVVACELVCARQASWLGSVELGPALEERLRPLVAIMEPVEADRPLGPEIAEVVAWLDGSAAPV